MKVRACVMAAVMAAAISGSSVAGAQETTKAPAPPVDIVDVAQFFAAPRALGHAWERAVRAVLDGMHALLEEERVAAQQALAAAPPPKRTPAWQVSVPATVPREARKVQPVAFHPVAVDPVTEVVADVRGQRAILLGAGVELPWTVP